MSYSKIVKIYCDGPKCRKEVYGETAAEARLYAKRAMAWFENRKYQGWDFCSEACHDSWYTDHEFDVKSTESNADVPEGTLQATVIR